MCRIRVNVWVIWLAPIVLWQFWKLLVMTSRILTRGQSWNLWKIFKCQMEGKQVVWMVSLFKAVLVCTCCFQHNKFLSPFSFRILACSFPMFTCKVRLNLVSTGIVQDLSRIGLNRGLLHCNCKIRVIWGKIRLKLRLACTTNTTNGQLKLPEPLDIFYLSFQGAGVYQYSYQPKY